MRSTVYQYAKGELETQPFGTYRDPYRVGYDWAAHSLDCIEPMEEGVGRRVRGASAPTLKP